MNMFRNFMPLAFAQAEIAATKDEFPVGAVVVSPTGEVIASAHNLTRTLCDPTAHAEILALRMAAEKIGNYRLLDCDLYVTLEPCVMCAGAVSHARIRRLYYAVEDSKGGGVSSGVRFFNHPSCMHTPEIYYPFDTERGTKIIHDFVKKMRI
jgi:tRNA(adenine34) deaminase